MRSHQASKTDFRGARFEAPNCQGPTNSLRRCFLTSGLAKKTKACGTVIKAIDQVDCQKCLTSHFYSAGLTSVINHCHVFKSSSATEELVRIHLQDILSNRILECPATSCHLHNSSCEQPQLNKTLCVNQTCKCHNCSIGNLI